MRLRHATAPIGLFVALTLALTVAPAHVPDAHAKTEELDDAFASGHGAGATAAGTDDGAPPPGMHCAHQTAQPFLVRPNWWKQEPGDPPNKGQDMLKEAIRYRTEKYGYFAGFGSPSANPKTPGQQAVATTFMGLPISVHKKMLPALKCVERALKDSKAGTEYKPHGLSGIRFKNTYYGGEVSNHVYGIAIDIDPDVNTCCHCVGKWKQAPQCAKKGTAYDHMSMPRSWVDTFERYGFYWLGHDPSLEDTMHFEFLGDPDKVFTR